MDERSDGYTCGCDVTPFCGIHGAPFRAQAEGGTVPELPPDDPIVQPTDNAALIATLESIIEAQRRAGFHSTADDLQRCRDRLAQPAITDAEVAACLEPLPTRTNGYEATYIADIAQRAEQMQGVIRRLAHPAVTQTGWRNLYLNWRQIAEKLERGITIARASCERKDKALREFLDAVRGHGWEDCDPTTAEARAVRFARAALSDTQEPPS